MAGTDFSPGFEPRHEEVPGGFHEGFRASIVADPNDLRDGFKQRGRDQTIDVPALLVDAARYVQARFFDRGNPATTPEERVRLKEAFLAGYTLRVSEGELAELEANFREPDSPHTQSAA